MSVYLHLTKNCHWLTHCHESHTCISTVKVTQTRKNLFVYSVSFQSCPRGCSFSCYCITIIRHLLAIILYLNNIFFYFKIAPKLLNYSPSYTLICQLIYKAPSFEVIKWPHYSHANFPMAAYTLP